MLTEEQIKALIEASTKAALEAFSATVDQKVASAQAATLKRIEKIATPPAPKKDDDNDEADDKPDAKLEAKKGPVAKVQAELAAMKAEAQAERAKREAIELQSALDSGFAKINIAPALRPAALALLREEKRVSRSDDGSFLFDTKDPVVGAVDINEGLAKWAAKDGAAFLAARDAGGSGNSGVGKPGAPSTGPLSRDQVNATIGSLMG